MYLYLLIFTLIFFFEVIYFKIADHYNIIDKPNHRSSHVSPTIRGGGIIFGISTILFFIFYDFQYPYFLAGVLLISVVSFADDLFTLNNKVRLIIQLISLILMFYELDIYILSWYLILISTIFVLGTINAYNFMDGINGITGVYSLLIITTLYYINAKVVYFTSSEFLLITALSLLVFLFFNFRTKAKCFAGDVGSVSIAFIILFFLLQLILKTENLNFLMLLLVYGLDTVSTIVFRYLRNENIFEAHRSHFYQYWSNERKVSHLVVAGYYALAQLLVNAMLIYIMPNSIFLLCLFLFFSAAIFLTIRFLVEGSSRLLGR